MKKLVLLLTVCCFCVSLYSQNVGIGTSSPATTAALDINASNKGILVPRLTAAQKLAISNPANGLLVYQTDADTGFHYFNGTVWKTLLERHTGVNNNPTILYRKTLAAPSYENELWAVNLDGTNKRKINISLPANMEFEFEEMARLTPDGKKIILLLNNKNTYQKSFYTCNIDGSGLTPIIEEDADTEVAIQIIY